VSPDCAAPPVGPSFGLFAGKRSFWMGSVPLRNRWFADSPLEEPGFEPLVPLCGVVVSGGNRNAGIGEEDDLEGVVCRGDRAFESHLLQQSDCTTLRHRLAPRTVLSLIDAAGPWRDWQPEAGKGGHPTQSPRFRLWARLEAERTLKQSRPKSKFLGSIHELFARGKPR